MPARRPAEAVDRFARPLQLAISCISKAVVRVSGYAPSEGQRAHVAFLGVGEPVALRRVDFSLSVRVGYQIEKRGSLWEVRETAYWHAFWDAGGRELLTYHWHPDAPVEDEKRVVVPHLHLRGVRRFEKTHLPTGEIRIGSVIRLAIEMGAKPLRADWESALGSLA